MTGNPADFEAIGNRLGFRLVEESPERLELLWQGPRFPAFLCLGIAVLLLFISIPISQAIYIGGLASRASSLWYFPLMNLVLLGISVYLLTQRRSIVIHNLARTVTLSKRSFHKNLSLTLPHAEIDAVKLGRDQVYSGFAVAGSTSFQQFPVPSLRLMTKSGVSVLLDRGGAKRLEGLGEKIAKRFQLSLEVDPELRR